MASTMGEGVHRDDHRGAVLWPSPGELIEVAIARLRTAPPQGEPSTWMEADLARSAPEPDAKAVRELAASALRRSLRHDVETGEFTSRARKLLSREFSDLDADEIVNDAFEALLRTVERYERGAGKYALPEPALFPVEKQYMAWTATYVYRAARSEIQRRRWLTDPPLDCADPPPPPGPLEDAAEAIFAQARASVEAKTHLHPDLRATLAGRRTDTARWRPQASVLASLEVLNAIEHGVDGEPVTDVLDRSRGALRAVAGPGSVKAIDKRVSRFVGDVVYTVGESLQAAVGPQPRQPRDSHVWRYVSTEATRWRAAQLVTAIAVLGDVLSGEIEAPARLEAIASWTEDLMTWLRRELPHPRVVAAGAADAVRACLRADRPPSPLERARAAVAAGPDAKATSGRLLLRLHGTLVDVLGTKETP